ncbi:MAG: HD-GYP domain-containing protein [Alphaproteobacteria bacterium]
MPSLTKGLAFVVVTGVLLFAVLLRSYMRIEDANALQLLRFSQTITALARMIELRDIYTHGHQKRAAQIADALAARLGLPRERRLVLTLAAELHDIGKIGVPEHLLNKAGFMTDAELARIHEHAAIGAELLRGVDFPGPVADIVAQHHERLDGSGYPHGLAGDEIMLEARILAVADAFEAMSNARPYRNAQGSEVALVELRRGAGVKYDARVVAECDAWNRECQTGGKAYSAAGKEKAGGAAP